jgi:phosphoesterase RecJ-like protein
MKTREGAVKSRTKAAEVLRSPGSFLIASHRRPDGDAIGSMLALADWLESRGSRSVCLLSDGVPEPYTFLPRADRVVQRVPSDLAADAALVVDTPDPGRLSARGGTLSTTGIIINIDHHPDNTLFGDINLVDVSASSAALLVYELLEPLGGISAEAAGSLYVGAMTDTGCFRFGNTDARTLSACAGLAELGARPAELARSVYGEQPPGRLRLLGLILSCVEVSADGRVALLTLNDEMRRAAGDSGEAIESIASYGRLIRGVQVAVLLREEPGGIRASLRSAGDVDVNEVARRLGGGGHRAASGAMLDAVSMESARRRVLAAVSETMERSS